MSKTSFDSANKIWRGSKIPTIFNSNLSLGYLVLNVLQNSPDAVTQISADSGAEVTCREMYRRSVNIATHLQGLGYSHGDVSGFVALNSENLAPIVFACLTIGLPVNCLATAMSESELISYYFNTKPKLIFCDADVVQKMERVAKQLPTNCVIFTVDKKVEGFEFIGDVVNRNCDTQLFEIPYFDSNSLAFILATSGSYNPKQACKTHKEMIEHLTLQWKSKLSSQEIWFGLMAIHWITGILTLLLSTLYGGKRVITTHPFEPSLMIDLISKYNVTTMIIVPRLLAIVLSVLNERKQSLSSMRVLIVGGTLLSKQMTKKAKLFFPDSAICSAYGSSEGGTLSMNLSNTKYESVGQLCGNVEMKILDDSGNKLGVDEAGEIVHKTPTIFAGYFNDPAKTEETIKNGWIYSGDVGYFDKDGFLYFVDRKKDVFKYDGVSVSAAELESITGEISDVSASCVVAVYQEDVGNELIFAFVVKKPDSELTEKFIEDYVSERVIAAKKIRGGVHFVDCLPFTFSGKIRRGEVKKWAKEKYEHMKLHC